MALVLNSLQDTVPYWVFDAENGACPHCDPGMAMDQDSFWRCDHMQRLVVDEEPSLGRPHDGRVCPGNCPQHPLVEVSGYMRLFQNATLTGLWWGDVMLALDEAERDAETSAQRAARLVREAVEREAARIDSEASAVSYHVQKCASVYCDRSGGLKKTVLRKCKWDDHPAENGFPAGCAAHHKGACPWVHKSQPELMKELLAGSSGSRPASASNMRDFSALGAPARPGSGGRPPVHNGSRPSSGGFASGGSRGAGSGGSRAAGSGVPARHYPGASDGSAW